MYQENDHSHYTKDEIKEMFKENMANGNWPISRLEYDRFCKLLSCLNTQHADLVKDEIQIIIFSEQKEIDWDNKKVFACYLNLRDENFLKLKKGVIFLSSDFLNLEFGIEKLKKLFHEIAHHKLGHPTKSTEEEAKENEKAADELAFRWCLQEAHHLEDC